VCGEAAIRCCSRPLEALVSGQYPAAPQALLLDAMQSLIESMSWLGFVLPAFVALSLLGVGTWARGPLFGIACALAFLLIAMLSTLAIELVLQIANQDATSHGSYRGRALRSIVPWVLVTAVGGLVVGLYVDRSDRRQLRRVRQSLETVRKALFR
jgi:hypothetical protein